MLRPIPQSDGPADDGGREPNEPRGSKAGFWLVIVIVVAVFAAMGALFFAASGEHDAPESLTSEELSAAETRWRETKPAAYTVELEFSGSRSGREVIEVATEAVVEKVAGDEPGATIRRVEDMFQIIRDDLTIVLDPTRVLPPGMAGTKREPLRATFDEKTGLPTAYDRPLLENRSAFGWRVARFEAK